jgi:hypothetical protein
MFIIEDEIHAEQQKREFDSFKEAIMELESSSHVLLSTLLLD